MTRHNIHSHCGRARSHIGKWLINRKLRKLKLDDSQKEQLDTVFDIASSASRERYMLKHDLHEHFTEMMSDKGFDRDLAVELVRTATTQQADRAAEVVQAFGDLYETLAPWQQQQVLAMLQKRRHCRLHQCH